MAIIYPDMEKIKKRTIEPTDGEIKLLEFFRDYLDDSFEVFFTPGHSQGSLCLYASSSQSLISGDTIFAHGDFGRYDLPGGSLTDLAHSIQQLSTLSLANLYPGHGPWVEGQAQEHVALSWKNVQLYLE